MSQKHNLSRRKALNSLLSLFGIGAFGTVIYPIIRFIFPPEQSEPDNISKTLMETGEMNQGEYRIFEFNRKPAIFIRIGPDPSSADSYRALSAVCSHLQCTVQYEKASGQIWCACHNGRFSLTGNVLSGPPPSPLETFKVDILEGKIIVTRKSA